jgi:hypothetical protein
MRNVLLLACLLPALIAADVVQAEAVGARDAACMAYCESLEAGCSRHARQVAQACSRSAATGGVDPFTQRRAQATDFCAYFLDPGNCLSGYGQAACVERFSTRHGLCSQAYVTNTASEYLKCSEGERTALQVCREELAVCQASC